MAIWQDINGGLYDDMNAEALSLSDWPKGLTLLTAAQAQAAQNPLPTAAQRHQQLQAQAAAALSRTDAVAGRCFKAGVAYPPAWQTYTATLRAIANGTDTVSTALPAQPAYPAGT